MTSYPKIKDRMALARHVAELAWLVEDDAAAVVARYPQTVGLMVWAKGFAERHEDVGLAAAVGSVLERLTGARPMRPQAERASILAAELAWLREVPFAVPRETEGLAYARAGVRPPWVALPAPPPPAPPPAPAPLPNHERVLHAIASMGEIQKTGRVVTNATAIAIARAHDIDPTVLGAKVDP